MSISIFKVSFAVLIFSGLSNASNYPSNYPTYSDRQTNGPVEIVRSAQGSGAVSLRILYKGPLKSSATSLFVYIKINYLSGSRQATFPMEKIFTFGKFDGYTVTVTNGCLVGMMGGCALAGSDEMKHLFYWASGARGLNKLEMEIAIADGRGGWDSNYSQNYKFHFPQHYFY